MSNTPEPDIDLELHFLPAWAKQSPQTNRYAHFEGESARPDRGGNRGERPRGRSPSMPPRGGAGPQGRPRPDRARPQGRDRFSGERRDDRPVAPAPTPLPEINVAFVPEEHGVDSLTRQIRMTGRAYPLFDIAHLILQKPERHDVVFTVKKTDGAVAQPLFLCALDDSLWLSEADAVRHALDRHFATFYQAEKTQIDAPKGTYTFVAQCGMSGAILGPPNYHDYQNQLRKLHAERFSRMPFEAFKARVRIVKDEAVVKKWVEDQSWKTEFVCLNVPEALRLGSRDEVEKHFRQVHLPNIVKTVETYRMGGAASRGLRDRGLTRLLRERWEEQRRFPLQLATVLSQQFASRGLQFFKVNKTVTHVSVARPHYLDLEATPVSDGVRRIVDFINSHPKATHKQLLQALVPKLPVAAPAAPVAAEGSVPVNQSTDAAPPPELAAVMTDLHWLVHQGHVIEFANGVLETAKKPLVRPPKPAPATPPQAPGEPALRAELVGGAEGTTGAPSAEAAPAAAAVLPEAATSLPKPVVAAAPEPEAVPPAAEASSEPKPGA